MTEAIVQFFSGFPHWLATFLMAMVPMGEAQLAIPVAILGYQMPAWQAFLLALAGNMVPPTIILLGAKRFHDYVQANQGFIFGKAWLKQLARAQKKFEGDYQKYGLLGLMFFVILPVPLTGAWTASLAAFVFGLPMRKAWPFIFIGILGSTFITLVFTVGIGKIF